LEVGVMTKADLVKQIGKKAGISQKAAASALNAFVGAIHDSLKKKGGRIRVSDLGTFLVAHRKARTGINPQNKKKIHIPATNVPRFRAAKALKQEVIKAK
jgi:DNA-binding protein HU-beta